MTSPKPRQKLDPGVNPPVEQYEVDGRAPGDRDGNAAHAKALAAERAKAKSPRGSAAKRPAGRAKSPRRVSSSH
jgi:hypothetical protein